MEKTIDALDNDYIYVPNDTILSNGKYMRFLDLKDAMSIKLRLGGFVTNDNGYSFTIVNNNRCLKFSKRNKLIFSRLSDSDKIRAAINEYVN